jgi:hypothetical protein
MADIIDPQERASDEDAAWFRRHPHRKHRIRAARPGEFGPGNDFAPPLGMHNLVAVRQVIPGVRIRLQFALRDWPSEREASARTICAMLARGDIEAPTLSGRRADA